MSVAMAFAECQDHSAQRQKKARAREEEREVHCTAAFWTTGPPPEPELFDLFEEPGEVRPDPHRRPFSLGADPRCTCAADGGPDDGCLPLLWNVST